MDQPEAKNKITSFTNKDEEHLQGFFAGAIECELDKQGRILIPQNLRDRQLDKDIYNWSFHGVEIWDKANGGIPQ